MHKDFLIPGTTGPRLTARRPFLRDVELYADGQPLKRLGWLRHSWWVEASDGRQHELRLSGGLSATSIEVDEQRLELEPALPLWQRALMLLPLLLIFVGGLVGGLFGGLGVEVNRRLARSELMLPGKVLGMLITTVAAGGLWFGSVVALGYFFAPVPELPDGACYTGFWDGWEEDAGTDAPMTQVDCAQEHDTEVAGEFQLSDGAFPGVDAMEGWAEQACPAIFARYMGVPPEDSMFFFGWSYPDQDLWGRGARDIDCLVTLGTPGETWSGSVMGSGL